MNSIHTLTGMLSVLDFPATRDDILRVARTDFVDRRLERWLESLPEGSYDGAWQVCQTLASASGNTSASPKKLVGA
jgi:hypothetical protein